MKTVIEMAREAGIRDCTCGGSWRCLERFADLVRADAIADAVEREREAIAKWLEDEKDAPYWAELVRARRSNT